MLDKLQFLKDRFNEVSKLIVDPEIISDMGRYVKLNKEYKDLEQMVTKIDEYEITLQNLKESKEILETEKDDEMRSMAKEQQEEASSRLEKLEEEIKFLLVPKDPEDSKNAVMEIRAGSGGDEASIFAGDLYRMYTRYCETHGFKLDLVDVTHGTNGGYKEIIFNVNGPEAYGTMKFESGVHRVQRVPATESQGRVHTSAASVAVLPEVEDVEVELKDSDLRVDSYCSSGPGGQSVNTTYSAIRITHIPTGVVAQCQDQKSKLKNHEKALKVLRSRIYEIELKKHNDEIASRRKTMVSTGDRSAKIRTYNYPQGRVTDHRINLTLYSLDAVMNGDIVKLLDELALAENTEKLRESEAI